MGTNDTPEREIHCGQLAGDSQSKLASVLIVVGCVRMGFLGEKIDQHLRTVHVGRSGKCREAHQTRRNRETDGTRMRLLFYNHHR